MFLREPDMPGSWLFKAVPIFIVFVFVLILAWYLCIGILGVKLVKEVDKNGAKSVIERVWNGQNTTNHK